MTRMTMMLKKASSMPLLQTLNDYQTLIIICQHRIRMLYNTINLLPLFFLGRVFFLKNFLPFALSSWVIHKKCILVMVMLTLEPSIVNSHDNSCNNGHETKTSDLILYETFVKTCTHLFRHLDTFSIVAYNSMCVESVPEKCN